MRKIFYALICIQISFLLLLCGCTRKETTKQGFEYYITSGYNYTLKDGKAVLIEKTVNKDDEIINLPDEIDGYPVIGIGRYHYTFITEKQQEECLRIMKVSKRSYCHQNWKC